MNRLVMTFAALLGLLGLRAAERDFTQYVNPLMGTQSSFELSAGNTYPVTALPWGMNFWTPQTGKMGDGWQYTYTANRIRGFKQTHQPSPWINDFGQFSLMPVTGSPEFDEDRRASWFSHKGETSRPYYYKVYLAEHDVVAEMAPTERAALFRFTFPETEQAYVVVDAFDRGSSVRIIPGENKVVGYSTRNSGGVPAGFRNYFVMVFDRPFEYRAIFADSVLTEKMYSCHKNGIAFSMLVQGAELWFVSLADITSVFGNILSNAIEYEQGVEDREKRYIFLKVFRTGKLVCIHAENYCTEQLQFKDSLPLTTKGSTDYHGFGLKSVRYVVRKYGGNLAVSADGQKFIVDIIIPVPREKK